MHDLDLIGKVARGEEALSILESRKTQSILSTELAELHAFLAFRKMDEFDVRNSMAQKGLRKDVINLFVGKSLRCVPFGNMRASEGALGRHAVNFVLPCPVLQSDPV